MDGNTEAPAKLPTLLEQIRQAKGIVEFDAVEAGLAELEAKHAGVVFDVATKEGLAAAKAARAEVREVRYSVQNLASDMKDPLNRLKKLIDGGAERIKARVLKVEEPIDAQIKAEEARIEAEKERKRLEAEALRKARQDKIDAMRNAPVALAGQPSEKIAEALAEIQGREVTLEEFGDLAGAAMTAQTAAVAALTAMHNAATFAEEQAAELAKLRAEAEERRKAEEVEAERRRAADAEAERKRKAEEAEAQKRRDDEAAAEAEQLRKKAEDERIAREKSDAELAELRAKLAAMQAAQQPAEPEQWTEATKNAVLRQEGTPAPVDAEGTPPTDADPGDEAASAEPAPARSELIAVIADQYATTEAVAEGWLVAVFGGAK